mgnify:CR=1 FL=1
MSNKISRRTFLKVTGASAAALGAAAVLGGCQAGDNSSIEVKVGDKISNWNNLAVQLTSVFTLASAPDAEGYEYIAMLITSANRSSRDTFAIGAQNILEIGEAYPLDTPEQIAANTAGYFHALSASTTDFAVVCDGADVDRRARGRSGAHAAVARGIGRAGDLHRAGEVDGIAGLHQKIAAAVALGDNGLDRVAALRLVDERAGVGDLRDGGVVLSSTAWRETNWPSAYTTS